MSEQDQQPAGQESELGPEQLEKVNGGSRVNKVDAITIKQKVTESPVGEDALRTK